MGTKKKDYRGYEIWEWEEGEKTPQRSYSAVSKGDLPDLAGYRKTPGAVEKLIDAKLDQPPIKVEEYKGVEIYYHGNEENYQAKVGPKRVREKKIEQVRKTIDERKK